MTMLYAPDVYRLVTWRLHRNASSTVSRSNIAAPGLSSSFSASARVRSERATMPASLPSRTTDTRLMFLAYTKLATSHAGVSSETVVASGDMTEFTLRWCGCPTFRAWAARW
jgi:hypothetical protein